MKIRFFFFLSFLFFLFPFVSYALEYEEEVLLSNTWLPTDVLYIYELGSVASSTDYSTYASNVYWTRYFQVKNTNLVNSNKVYVFSCGASTASYAIEQSSVIVESGNFDYLPECTATFYDDYKDNFTKWAYFYISTDLTDNSYVSWRVPSGDSFDKILVDESNTYYYDSGVGGTHTYTDVFPDDADSINYTSNYNDHDSYFVVTFSESPYDSGVVGYQTRFLDVSASLSTTTKLNLDVDVWLDNSDWFSSYNRPMMVEFSLWGATSTIEFQRAMLPSNWSGSGTTSVYLSYSDDLSDGTYTVIGNFLDTYSDIIFPRSIINYSVTISGGVVTDSDVVFIRDGTLENDAFESWLPECSIFRPHICMQNFTYWAFSFSNVSVSSFNTIYDLLITKFPFSYFSQISTVITDTVSSVSTSTFPTIDVTIMDTTLTILNKDSLDSIYPTETRLLVRSVMGYILWIFAMLSAFFLVLNMFHKGSYKDETSGSDDISSTGSPTYSGF